jgi:hypothetical protein
MPGQLFDARGTIDCWADAGEIEPIAATDIAVENITEMPWGAPKIRALIETTYFAGLRRTGMPEE